MRAPAFPEAEDLPRAMKVHIVSLGKLWAKDPKRPRVKRKVRQHWEKLISDWAKDDSLPLYVRKQRLGRGSIRPHISHRSLVPTDNSPAKWVFVQAFLGRTPSLREISKLVEGDQIPVTISHTKLENPNAHYGCTLDILKKQEPNSAGWKLAHIDGVRIRERRRVEEIDIANLQGHFVRLMTPSNMFVINKKYGGLAELPEFRQQISEVERRTKNVIE